MRTGNRGLKNNRGFSVAFSNGLSAAFSSGFSLVFVLQPAHVGAPMAGLPGPSIAASATGIAVRAVPRPPGSAPAFVAPLLAGCSCALFAGFPSAARAPVASSRCLLAVRSRLPLLEGRLNPYVALAHGRLRGPAVGGHRGGHQGKVRPRLSRVQPKWVESLPMGLTPSEKISSAPHRVRSSGIDPV